MTYHILQYLEDISHTEKEEATEHSYRRPLEKLLKELISDKFDILHEPGRVPGIGAPDFCITKGGAVVGYIECKRPGKNIDKLISSRQVEEYKKLSLNIIITDYRQFVLLQNGKDCGNVYLTNKNGNELAKLLLQFFLCEPQKIKSAQELAKALAVRCSFLRLHLEAELEVGESNLCGLYKWFQITIYHNINTKMFADALAQTLVYVLLMAKLKAISAENITLFNVEKNIPQNFALIREIIGFIRNLDNIENNAVDYYVHDILKVINSMDVVAVGESMSYNKKTQTDEDDPYLYFYEKFLASYDAKLRKTHGVYCTPPPVVRFIVRATDDILRRDFKLDGLEDTKVTALDFAAGTGTFMLEMFRTVLGEKSNPKRQAFANEHLLRNFYGFEFLITPYVIAHLKLSQFLSDKGVELNKEQRINVFLTNTLEEVTKYAEISFMPALTEEMNLANNVKNNNILVIVGNPPYSAVSQNNREWIRNLIEDYKKINGKRLSERNPKMLQDDYVKFIRLAQHKIDQAGEGIVAIITNHAFLDNPTFRGMRHSLLTSFNRLYFLDLHGNTKKQEHAPDGGKDENVFDIQQGVVISIFVKKDGLSKGVFHADMFGLRDSKYKQCEEQSIESIDWKPIKPKTPFYIFKSWDNKGYADYQQHWQISDIFITTSTGITTHRDKFAFAYERKDIEKRITDMANKKLSDIQFQEIHNVNETQGWNLSDARCKIQKTDIKNKPQLCAYRPFDSRWCLPGYETMDRPRLDVMKHMLAGDNLGLVLARRVTEKEFNHVMVVDKIIESNMALGNKGGTYLYPLYLYEDEIGKDEQQKRENFEPEFRKWINDRYGKTSKKQYSPEEILGYIYAILHSPNYRKKYAEFLRIDFPHIPFPKEEAKFTHLAKIGNELIDAHLLNKNCDGEVTLQGDKTEVVEAVRHTKYNEYLYFNKHQYFAPISLEAYNFQIGGYKPLEKFLKSRKGRKLSLAEIKTMEKAANAIIFTMKKMQKIDEG